MMKIFFGASFGFLTPYFPDIFGGLQSAYARKTFSEFSVPKNTLDLFAKKCNDHNDNSKFKHEMCVGNIENEPTSE